nr:uncharacterized protein LOC133606773 isoform X1 [Nerophis lumbriciformis]XP_061817075.1 uncharacterized protein LOC133606773 isoform X1 [Nerophis lumbriciformis]
MEDISYAPRFANFHPPHASFHLTQSPEVDSLQLYGGSATSFPSWRTTGDTCAEDIHTSERFADAWEPCEDIYGNVDGRCNNVGGEHGTSNGFYDKPRRMSFRGDERTWDGASSREDMDQPPWLQSSSVGQLPSSSLPPTSTPQKLDSFSEAFLSRRRRTFPQVFHRESSGPIPESEVVNDTLVLKQKCVPPSPQPSHLRSPVFDPSQAPLPSTLMDFASPSSGGEAKYGTLDIFAAHFPSLSSLYSSVMWQLPVVRDGADSMEGHLSASLAGDYHSIRPFPHPELAFPPHSVPSQAPQHWEAAASQPFLTHCAPVTNQNYTGTPFLSIFRPGTDTMRRHYTPRPLLNPGRRGTGLYSSLPSLHPREEETAEEEKTELGATAWVNTGKEFQAELPPEQSRVRSPDTELNYEQLLWKPQRELAESGALQDQVEKLLLLCSSSCLPGGGSNTELALHCLHSCKGDIVATLEMLLQKQAWPTGDYHYSGSDFWSEHEKSDFNAALNTYGKNFTRIRQMVKTKTTHQCVEFYYNNKKLQDKRRKQEEREKQQEKFKEVRYPCKQCGKIFFKIQSRNAHMKIHRQPQEDLTDEFPRHFAVNHPHPLEAPAVSFPCADSLLTLNLADIGTSEHVLTGSSNSQVRTIADARGSKQTETEPFALAFDQSWACFHDLFCESSQEVGGAQAGETKEPIGWF